MRRIIFDRKLGRVLQVGVNPENALIPGGETRREGELVAVVAREIDDHNVGIAGLYGN